MASNLYSRYVPPAKGKVKLVLQGATEPALTPSAAKTPPSIKQDASSTYTRYNPPSKSKAQLNSLPDPAVGDLQSPRSVPKRKRDVLVESTLEPSAKKAKKPEKSRLLESTVSLASRPVAEDGPTSSTKTEGGSAEPKRTTKSPKGKLSEDVATSLDEEGDARHKKLMEKRERSLKKAEKLARKIAKQAAAEEETEQNGAEVVLEEVMELHDLVPLPQPDPVPEAPVLDKTSLLPSWMASPVRVSPNTHAAFSNVGIREDVGKALNSKGFKEAFAVQVAVLPLLLPGPSCHAGDVLVSAATGSGKTLAYVLPMIEDISQYTVTKLRGLIVLPTRELVSQAREVCEVCATASSSKAKKRVKIGTAVGHESFKVEQKALMEQEIRYEPVKYEDQLRRLNAKWETSDRESGGEDELLCEDEFIPRLPGHIIEPTSKVDILICTPGRLVEHLQSSPGFSLEYVKWFVVDEADKLLDQSFQQWLGAVLAGLGAKESICRSKMAKENYVRKVILSATMTADIGKLKSLQLYRPKLVVLEGSTSREHDLNGDRKASQLHVLPQLLVEATIKVDDESVKPLYLIELLATKNMIHESDLSSPTSIADDSTFNSDDNTSDDETSTSGDSSTSSSAGYSVDTIQETSNQQSRHSARTRGVLIFTKSNEAAMRLSRLIALLQPKLADAVGTLTSTTRSSTRRATLSAFRSGKISILVASDLVSRGLDLPDLAHVINYDIPTSLTSYVHRVGRTARAGKPGYAWTLITNTEARWFWTEIARTKSIERETGSKVSRVHFDRASFDVEKRAEYERCLEQLGREVLTSKSQRTNHI